MNNKKSINDDKFPITKEKSSFVYILSNPAMPGLFKIGKTKDIEKRVRVLNKETGIPFPFKVEYKISVENAIELELLVHAALHKYRIDVMKEFFSLNKELAISKLKEWAIRQQKEPGYFKTRFPNFGQPWSDDLALNAIELYKTNNDILQTAFWCGKTPYEVETFLNRIGYINSTKFPNSIPRYEGYKQNCYQSGKFR